MGRHVLMIYGFPRHGGAIGTGTEYNDSVGFGWQRRWCSLRLGATTAIPRPKNGVGVQEYMGNGGSRGVCGFICFAFSLMVSR